MKTPLSLFLLVLSYTAAWAQSTDVRLSSWLTSNSGKYARISETDAEATAGTTKTTWTRGPLSQTSPAYAGPTQIDYSTSWVYVRTPSLGTYNMGPWYNDAARTQLFVNVPKNQGLIIRIPRTTGTIPTTKTQINGLNIGGVQQPGAGFYVDGVLIFDPTDGFSYSGGTEASPGTGQWHRDAYVNESITFDYSMAHQQNTGVYHNHANPIALRYQLGDAVSFNSTTKKYAETMSPTQHSPIIGWMLDGLPVYGPYGYSSALDANSGVRRMVGGFVKRDGTTTGVDNITSAGRTLPAWMLRNNGNVSATGPTVSTTYPLGRYIQDWAYLGDLQKSAGAYYQQGTDFDLNEYNVRYCVTPEFPSGTWAYFLNISATGTPQFPYMINRWFYGTPTGGKVNSIAETVTTHLAGGPNRALSITNAAVASPNVTLTWNAVEGGSYTVEASSNNSTWTTKATGLTVSAANTKSNSHATLSSTGTEYARVSRTALATYDTTGVVTPTVSQTTSTSFDLNPNAAPTLNTISTLTGASENSAFSISYGALLAASNAADSNGDTIRFRIEAVSTGTLTKDGNAVTAGSTLLSSGETLAWTPALNANGTLAAFTVKAWDGALASSTAVQVNVSVTAVNYAPTISTVSVLTGGTEDVAYTISYAALLAATDATDADGDAILFIPIDNFNGTLTKNGAAIVGGVTTLGTGESFVWTPQANLNGTQPVMQFVASDSIETSNGSVTVSIDLANVPDAPTLTEFININGPIEDTPFTLTYEVLAASGNDYDADGDVISFRVESVLNGTLTKNGVAVVPGSTLLSTGESLAWTPTANAFGNVQIASFRTYDGTQASATAVSLTANTTGVADGAIWDGGTGINSWAIAENWLDDALPGVSDTVQFTGASPYNLFLEATRSVTGVSFSGSSGYTLNSNTLTLASGGSLSTSTPASGSVTHAIASAVSLSGSTTADIAPSASLTISGAITGTGLLTKTGTGTLTISGNTSLTNTTTVSEGTLQIGNDSTTNFSGNIIDNASVLFNRKGTMIYADNLSGSGNVQINNTNAQLVVTGALTHTGGTTITMGELAIGNGGTTGSISGSIVNNGALTFNRGGTQTLSNPITGAGSLEQQAGTLTLTAANMTAGILLVSNTSTLRLTGTSAVFPYADISSGGTLGVESAGTTTMGEVTIASSNGSTGTLNIVSGATLASTTCYLAVGKLSTGFVTVNGGTWNVSGTLQRTFGDWNSTATLSVNHSGSVSATEYTGGGTITTALDNGSFTFTNASSITSDVSWSIGSSGGTISNASDVTLSGSISGSGALTKTGTGTLMINGSHTRTGHTTVSAGTLSISSASFDDASNLSLASGATLNLNHSATDTINALYLNGVQQVAGTWGSLTSSATNKTAQITGDGILSVTTGPVNTAPVIGTSSYTDSVGTGRFLQLFYSQVLSLGNITDAEGDTITLRIESVGSGTLLVNGQAVTAGVTTLSNSQTLFWTPPAGQTGTMTAYTLRAYDGHNYSTGVFTVSATVFVDNTTLAGWTSAKGLSGADAEDAADPENDGLGNALEYVLGLDPVTNNTNPMTSTVGGDYLTLTFPRADMSENDMSFGVEVSSDLTNWTVYWISGVSTTASGVIITVNENGDANDTITVQIPTSSSTRLFSRLRAEVD